MKTTTTAALDAVNMPKQLVDELLPVAKWITSVPDAVGDMIPDRFWDRYDEWESEQLPQVIHDQLENAGLFFVGLAVSESGELMLECGVSEDFDDGDEPKPNVLVKVYPN